MIAVVLFLLSYLINPALSLSPGISLFSSDFTEPMPDASVWKQRSIYQVLTDRFAIGGAGDTGPEVDYLSRQHAGGNWQGIIDKLDYIQGMGFDAVWISPVTKNIENDTQYGTAYHGYWQEDLYSVNPHFGTAEDLMALSNALHARGMYLMVDVVVNHVASETTKVDFSRFIPFNESSYYHEESYITDYENQTQSEQGWLGDEKVPLPDLDTENPDVAHTLHAWISALVKKFHIDGLRIDTVKHVRKDFWPGFIRAAGVWCAGEVLSGNPQYLSAYQPYTGGLLDYATYYPLKRAFKTGTGSMYELTDTLKPSYRALWADPQQLATFMENHDMPRFTRDTSSDQTVVMNALCWTILTDGIPIVYYGQEQMFTGQSARLDDDQDSRQTMWTSRYQKGTLYKFIGLLNRARKTSWNTGFGSNLTIPLHTDAHVSVTQKGPMIMVLSNQGSKALPAKIQFPTSFPKDTVLVDILTGQSIKIKGSMNVTIAAGQPQIFLPRAIATKIISEISPSPMTPIDKLFSFFRSSNSTTNDIAAWSTGARVNTREILTPIRVDVSKGRVLGPDPTTFASPHSIFQSPSYSAFSATTTPTIISNQDPRGRLSVRTQSSYVPPQLATKHSYQYQHQHQQQHQRQQQQHTVAWNRNRDASPAGSFTGQY